MWAPAIAALIFVYDRAGRLFEERKHRMARQRGAAGPCVGFQSRGSLHTKGGGSSADTGHMAGIGLCEKGVTTERIRPGMRKYPRFLEVNAFLVWVSRTKRGQQAMGSAIYLRLRGSQSPITTQFLNAIENGFFCRGGEYVSFASCG